MKTKVPKIRHPLHTVKKQSQTMEENQCVEKVKQKSISEREYLSKQKLEQYGGILCFSIEK